MGWVTDLLSQDYCHDVAKPNNYRNHIFENIDFVVYYYSTREQLNHFFSLAFNWLIVEAMIRFSVC